MALRFGARELFGSPRKDLRGKKGHRTGQGKLNHDASKTEILAERSSGAEMALQGCHKLCLQAVRSTPH